MTKDIQRQVTRINSLTADLKEKMDQLHPDLKKAQENATFIQEIEGLAREFANTLEDRDYLYPEAFARFILQGVL